MRDLYGLGSPAAIAAWITAIVFVGGYCTWSLLTRRAVTFLSFLLVMYVGIPFLIMYPFTFSPLNIVSTGIAGYAAYLPAVDEALFVSLTGVVALLVGYIAGPRLHVLDGTTNFAFNGAKALSHRFVLPVAVLGTLTLMLAIIISGNVDVSAGVRQYAMRNPSVRPFFNLASQLLPTMSGLTLLLAWNSRRQSAWVLAGLSIVGGILTGTRSAAFLGVISFVVVECLYASYRKKMGLRRALYLVPLGAILLAGWLALGLARAGSGSALQAIAVVGSTIFYGNNFSDLRDFAWILGFWHHAPLLGRTYAASLLGFIPSALLPFRVQWAIGRWTTNTTGLNFGEIDADNPGLRSGLFSEPYFNFGLVGVLILSAIFGMIVRDLHRRGRLAAMRPDPTDAKLRLFALLKVMTLSTAIVSSPALVEVYVMVGTLLVCRTGLFLLRESGTRSKDAVIGATPTGHASPLPPSPSKSGQP